MSKSKGNAVNPLELVDQYGADSVRFALVYGTALGNDQSLSYPKLEAMRKFTNKLWNMARFVEMKGENMKIEAASQADLKKIAKNGKDKEILEKTEKLIGDITRLIESYDFNHASQNLYEFSWHEFADSYIEDVKDRIDEDSFRVLLNVYLTILKLLHPFMPFVTEEIYKRLLGGEVSLIISDWPKNDK
jgi:valyl-tRNA synthetase